MKLAILTALVLMAVVLAGCQVGFKPGDPNGWYVDTSRGDVPYVVPNTNIPTSQEPGNITGNERVQQDEA